MTMGIVEEAADIIQERESTERVVSETAVVEGKGVSSDGRIRTAISIEQQSGSTHCGIGIGGVERQRGGADGGVGPGVSIRIKRECPKACVSHPRSKRLQGIASFRCSEVRVASVRRGINCLDL